MITVVKSAEQKLEWWRGEWRVKVPDEVAFKHFGCSREVIKRFYIGEQHGQTFQRVHLRGKFCKEEKRNCGQVSGVQVRNYEVLN